MTQKELQVKGVPMGGIQVGHRSLFTTRELTTVGMLAGITMLLGITGYGFVPLPYMKATILHLPVIIGAIIAGPRAGMVVGLLFGLFSMFQAVTSPVLLSFAFINPLISILPRVLLGVIAYLLYRFVPAKESIKIGVSAVITSLCHTMMVMGGIYLLYAKDFALARDIPVESVFNMVLGICIANGIPEAIVSGLIVVPIVLVLKKVRKK